VVCLALQLERISRDFAVIKAVKNGVNIVGLSLNKGTRFHHSEKLDKEVTLSAQFTENTSAIKVKL
jgi:transcription attenuation protein (tryptophan RNA-binding attenuator protein)